MAATESSTPVEAELSELTTESQTLSPDTADTVRSKRGDGNDKREAKVGEKEPRSLFSFEFVDEEDEETQRKRRSGSPGSDFLNLFASKLKPKGGLLSVSSPDRAYPGPISPEWQEPLHYGEKSFNLWGFKKAIFGAIVQAVKAITGGVLALKGQLLKVKGHIVEAKGKVLQTKGEAISQFGKHVATKALLNPAPHYGPSSAGSGPGISAPVHSVKTVSYPSTRETSCLKRIKIPEWDGGTGMRKIKVVKINKCAIRNDKWPPGDTAHISFPPGGPSGYAGPSPISASAPVYGPPIHSAGPPPIIGGPPRPGLPSPLPPKVIPAGLGPRPLPPLPPLKGIPSVYGPPSHSAGLGALPPSGGGGSYGPPPPGHFGGAPAAPSPFLSSYDRPQGPPAQGYGAPPPPGNEYLPAAGYGKPLQEYGQPYKRDSNALPDGVQAGLLVLRPFKSKSALYSPDHSNRRSSEFEEYY
ncbi:trithorax group protein osa isoform X2 [Nilaparvata lugens]|uniref:trithorax group protein osa isoform X2 n=1 Tax=Nilaparvata lugens TaxID=108931 RepID=UPI00193DD6F0|nr:trithorax group protein osa isoform X2 [Nilaparvata lugens]